MKKLLSLVVVGLVSFSLQASQLPQNTGSFLELSKLAVVVGLHQHHPTPEVDRHPTPVIDRNGFCPVSPVKGCLDWHNEHITPPTTPEPSPGRSQDSLHN